MSRRAGYEFPQAVRDEALRLSHYRCETCGKTKEETPEGFLSIHHVVPICIAAEFFPQISARLLKSLANTKVVCVKCHAEQDRLSLNPDYYPFFAQALLAAKPLPVPKRHRSRRKSSSRFVIPG